MGPYWGRLAAGRRRWLVAGLAALIVTFPAAIAAAEPASRPIAAVRGLQPIAKVRGRERVRAPIVIPRDTSGTVTPAQERPRERPKLPTVGPAWTFIGPRPVKDTTYGGPTGFVAGRVTSLATLPGSPFDIYAGTSGGGVWKSTNQGGTWIPITDMGPNLSLGWLPSHTTSQAVYAGTGEDDFNADAIPGVGILRLVNSTVTNVAPGLAGMTIGGLVVDRTTAHANLRLFAATSAGLYGSIGGGPGTWTPNYAFDDTMVIDGLPGHATGVIQDKSSASKFFVTVGDACRGTQGAAVVETVNRGTNWTPVLTIPGAGRMAVASGPNNTEYAVGAQCDGNLYNIWKSTAGGAVGTWHPIPASYPYDFFNPSGGNQGQGWYDIAIGVDPTNANNMVVEGVDAFATLDGGNSIHPVGKVYSGGPIHPDFHAVLFTGAQAFYAGNDGGVWSTTDMGGSGTPADWNNLNSTFGTTQFYAGSALDANNVLGGAQDNGNSGFFNGPTTVWQKYTVAGDGFFTAIDYTAGSTTIFGEYGQLGLLQGDSSTPATSLKRSPCSGGQCATAAFSAPFVLDASNPLRLLAGSTNLWESKNASGAYTGGTAWTQIGANLTYGTAHPYLFNANDSISSISVAPQGESNVTYTLSAQGRVFRTLDDQTFTDITSNLPPADPTTATSGWPWGSQIAVNPWNTDEAWVAITGSSVGHVWHTANGGGSWQDITGNLGDIPVTSVLPDPRQPNTIYIGTAAGVYVCNTCGGIGARGSWQHYGTGLPPVWIGQLTMSRDTKELVAWTHGRSAWTIPTDLFPGTQLVTQFPTSGATQGIANGPNGVWFTEGTKVGVAAIDGTVKEYPIPGAVSLQDITLGSDGNMWFTDSGANDFGSISPDGSTIHVYPTLQAGGQPRGIASGPDGNLYICDPGNNEIYVESTAGVELNRQHVPTGGSKPYEIVNGGDGYLYFTEFASSTVSSGGNGQIGVITPSPYAVTEVALPNNTIGPLGIARGPDGHVWYTEWGNGHVGELTSSGPFTGVQEFNVGGVHHTPSGLATGYDRNLWLAMQGLSTLERYNVTTHVVTSYTLPTPAYEIITGPDGNLWYTTQSGAIGRLEMSLS
jgi:streptogramin lyase